MVIIDGYCLLSHCRVTALRGGRLRRDGQQPGLAIVNPILLPSKPLVRCRLEDGFPYPYKLDPDGKLTLVNMEHWILQQCFARWFDAINIFTIWTVNDMRQTNACSTFHSAHLLAPFIPGPCHHILCIKLSSCNYVSS